MLPCYLKLPVHYTEGKKNMIEPTHQTLQHGDFRSYLSRAGEGKSEAILFLHGSGPGANSWSNWQFALPFFGEKYDSLAPDLLGFGQSAHPDPPPQGMVKWMKLWVDQMLSLLDTLCIEKAHLVGNSMGGAVALHLLTEQPDRFQKAVLMGAAGAPMKASRELDIAWGFFENPTQRRMEQIISWFAYDEKFVGDRLQEIARMRLEAAMKPEVRRSYEAMFPPPRQQHVDDLVIPPSSLRRIKNPMLLIHGRDDLIVPSETSYYLLNHLGGSVQLHVFGQCSHWTQIEFKDSFNRLVIDFIGGAI